MIKTVSLFVLGIIAISQSSNAQSNTFPTTGNVGIGTTSPQKTLHVTGTSMFDGTSIIKGTNQLRFYSDADGPYFTESYGIRAYPHYDSHSFMVLDQPLYVGYQSDGSNLNAQDGSILLSNKLGIGTKTPSRKIAINGASGSSLVDLGLYQNGTERAVVAVAGASNEIFTGTVAGDLAIRSTTGLLHFGSNAGSAAPSMSLLQNGNVGIGTTAPSAKLHSNGSLRFQGLANNNALDRFLVSDANGNVSYRDASSISGGTAGWGFGGNTVSTLKKLGTVDLFDLPLITNNIERMRVLTDGAIIVGATTRPSQAASTGALLAVNGQVFASKVKVAIQSPWADYVFNDDYQLRPLGELESFIKQKRHLPEVPTTADAIQDGVDLGDTQVLLLKKIEELTLYLIDQNKKTEALAKSNQEQNNQIKQQQKQIEELRKLLEIKK